MARPIHLTAAVIPPVVTSIILYCTGVSNIGMNKWVWGGCRGKMDG